MLKNDLYTSSQFKRMRFLFLLNLFVLFLFVSASNSLDAQDAYIRAPRLGITFINSSEHPLDERRYQNALMLGAGWTRYPIYWDRVEASPGQFNWGQYDLLAMGDIAYGLRINAILLGIPGGYRDGGSIRGLNEPVFADGTDNPAPGKAINPNNPFAVYAFQTVNHFKPGGELARQLGWQLGTGISVWEVWNEPDLTMFWTGGVPAYARMLKVGYLAIRQADPFARVMFAGLAYNNPDTLDWLDQTLAHIGQDPQRSANNWYFDIAAVHAYTGTRRSAVMVGRMRQVLRRYGLQRPIWLNESGAPVWDDYPGQIWTANQPEERQYRLTMHQQATYVIQSTAYAWAAGADVVFFHQLYDDCGNQGGGTDFAPGASAGDAHGFFRNERNSSCFTQHPQPGTARPSASAFYLMSRIFGGESFGNGQVIDLDGGRATVISFDRLSSVGSASNSFGGRIYVMWNRTTEPLNIVIPSSGGGLANLYTMDNQNFTIAGESEYKIGVPAATQSQDPSLPFNEVAAWGGNPLILVEQVAGVSTLIDPTLIHLEGSQGNLGRLVLFDGSSRPAQTTTTEAIATLPDPISHLPPTETPVPTIRPTTDPVFDITPPRPFILALPQISPPEFSVSWGAQEDGGVELYYVWVRVDGGEWQTWLETDMTFATYRGEVGKRYEFAVWAVDYGGNWSENTVLTPMAGTEVRE